MIKIKEIRGSFVLLAFVSVRSAATHLQPNLYHYFEWKNQQIKTKNSTGLEAHSSTF